MTNNIKTIKLLELYPDSVEYARKLCNLEDPKRLEDAIDMLVEWIKKQNHFVKKDFSRIYLETCLIGSKGSIERTKSKLDKLCTLRTLLPHFYTFNDIRTDFRSSFSGATIVPLPKLTKDHYRIVTVCLQNNEYFHSTPYIDYYKMLLIFCDIFKTFDYMSGNIFIYDYRDVNILEVVTKLNLVEIKQLATLMLDGHCMRIKGIYLMTPSKAVETLVKVIKPFFPAKIAERMKVFPTSESLHQALPQNILPVELGGTERSLKELQRDWIEQLSSDETMAYLNWIRQTGVNESCRIEERHNDYSELSGTFRTLNID